MYRWKIESISISLNEIEMKELFDAIRVNDIEQVQSLIDSDIDLNIQDNIGYTPLMRASEGGQLEIMKILLKAGATFHSYPNYQNKDEDTALIIASSYGKLEIVKLLLNSGADPNLQTKHGKTAFIEASIKGKSDCLILFGRYHRQSKCYSIFQEIIKFRLPNDILTLLKPYVLHLN